MRGLPPDVDVGFLVGFQLSEVTVDAYRVVLIFDDRTRVVAQSGCRVDGVSYEAGAASGARLVALVGRWVTAAHALDGRHIQLEFDGTHSVVLLEDDEPFESYTVWFSGGCIRV